MDKKPLTKEEFLNKLKTDKDFNLKYGRKLKPGRKPMALPPCHTMCQFYVRDNKLSCQLYQRSADVFLGVPFNIASYALLTHILAHLCGYEVGKFVHVLGDAHIYNNHIEQCKTMIKREDLKLPTLQFPNVSSLLELLRLKPESFVLENYKSHGTLTGKMAV